MALSRTGEIIPSTKQSVPLWEKEFCVKVGLFRWEEFVEAKKLVLDYHNVMTWDDSASEEAFNNAKATFKAHYFGIACPINDSRRADDQFVDWLTETDPELLRLRGMGTCPEDLAVPCDDDDDDDDDDENVICHCKDDVADYSRMKDDEHLLMWEKGLAPQSSCKHCSVPKDLWKIKDDATLIGEKGLARLEYQKEQGGHGHGHGQGEIYNIRLSTINRRNNWFHRIVRQIPCTRRYK